MKTVVSVDKLSKQYRLGCGRDVAYRTFRETIMDAISAPWRLWRGGDRASKLEIWALKDVSFEVKMGEVVGVIGSNGAGKSTLLKVLSRITSPSYGQIDICGRVGSLLEVGTGFHPELTGRENIFLNGSILGMSHREVSKKFEDIVEFAEVRPFLDTPVKRYSSGMYTRLAFAVASYLEPEILIVDEVLAVGDAAFQKKCLGKMGQVGREGRTVLFVSHNMTAVKSLCTRAILIEGGQVVLDGNVDQVVNRYLNARTEMAKTGMIPEDAPHDRDVPDEARFRSVRLTDLAGKEKNQFFFGQPFRVNFTCDVLKDIDEGHFEVSISTPDGTHVTYSTTMDGQKRPAFLHKGRHEVSAEFDVVLLPREYTIDLGIHHQDGATADWVQRTLDFSVLRVAENGDDHYRWGQTRGFVRAKAVWNFQSFSYPPPTACVLEQPAVDQVTGAHPIVNLSEHTNSPV